MDDQLLSRRQFTRESVLALLSGVVITVTGCGSDSSSPTAPTTGGGGNGGGGGGGGGNSTDVNGTVSANHGHVATVTEAHVNAGADVTIDITGNADHPHSVDLTAAQLTQIGDGEQVQVTSTAGQAHTHGVTFN